VARNLEYLAEALEEAEASARWYAERSPTAALGYQVEDHRRVTWSAISIQSCYGVIRARLSVVLSRQQWMGIELNNRLTDTR
jgi:hypothetical protein